ncbi:MAG: hypothetical protein ACO3BG_05780 [Candidatus Nanopelagicales bacterium]
MKLTTRIAILGGLAGFVFTRIPYMEDGNLLITNVVVLISAGLALISWKILNSIFKIESYFQRKRK